VSVRTEILHGDIVGERFADLYPKSTRPVRLKIMPGTRIMACILETNGGPDRCALLDEFGKTIELRGNFISQAPHFLLLTWDDQQETK